MGGMVTIDFKDPQDPHIRKIDFDFDAQDHSLIVVDTGGTHADLTDDYASVPTEMKSVARALDANVCREIEEKDLMARLKELRSETGDRALLRALHFLGDNQRVVDQVQALENNDFTLFLQMITESGNSSYKRLQNIISPQSQDEQGVALGLVGAYSALMEEVFGDDSVHVLRIRPLGTLCLNH